MQVTYHLSRGTRLLRRINCDNRVEFWNPDLRQWGYSMIRANSLRRMIDLFTPLTPEQAKQQFPEAFL